MKRLLLSLLCIQSISGMSQIDQGSVSAAQSLKVYTNNKKVFVEDENAAYSINPDRMNSELRKVIANKALVQFIKNGGYLRVNKDSEEKYNLAAKMRLNGGGPVLGCLFYCGIKVLAYAGIIGVTGGAVAAVTAATGGVAGPVAITASKFATAALLTGKTTAAIAAGVASTSVGTAAATVTTATIATAGSAGYLTMVEIAADKAFLVGLALPGW